jgi:hypothetical protein
MSTKEFMEYNAALLCLMLLRCARLFRFPVARFAARDHPHLS